MLTISLKHGARTLPGVTVERAGGAAALLEAVERATGVPQARAKLMQKAWKGTRPADADVAALADGSVVTVMGTAETATAAASAAGATVSAARRARACGARPLTHLARLARLVAPLARHRAAPPGLRRGHAARGAGGARQVAARGPRERAEHVLQLGLPLARSLARSLAGRSRAARRGATPLTPHHPHLPAPAQ